MPPSLVRILGRIRRGGRGISKTRHLSSLPRRKKEKTKSGEEREKKRKPLSGLKQRSFFKKKSCLLVSGFFFSPCVGVYFCFVALPHAPGFHPKKRELNWQGERKKNSKIVRGSRQQNATQQPISRPFLRFHFVFPPIFFLGILCGGRKRVGAAQSFRLNFRPPPSCPKDNDFSGIFSLSFFSPPSHL